MLPLAQRQGQMAFAGFSPLSICRQKSVLDTDNHEHKKFLTNTGIVEASGEVYLRYLFGLFYDPFYLGAFLVRFDRPYG